MALAVTMFGVTNISLSIVVYLINQNYHFLYVKIVVQLSSRIKIDLLTI